MGEQTLRPSKWRRLSSSRLLRIDPEDPCYNFDFLELPLEIKLLIICRYLSVKDVLSMSLLSKSYKKFIDQYFLRKEVVLPRSLEDYENSKEERYVLSLKVDFDEKGNSFKTREIRSMRERSFNVIKRLNFSKMKHVSLVFVKANSPRMMNSEDSIFRSSMSICPWYAEISECFFENLVYLQSVDLTIFKCGSSFLAMNVLANNAPYLREVTLRSPEEFLYHTPELEDEKTKGDCSLSMFLSNLVKKTAITYLKLVNFHENSPIWSEAQEDGYFLILHSKTLERLILSSSSKLPDNKIGRMGILCPNLLEMSIISENGPQRCLFHMELMCITDGLGSSFALYCPRLKWFNNMRLYSDLWYTILDNGKIRFNRDGLCSKKCGLFND